MLDWLQLEFMQRALLAGLLVAAICPMIGLFLVLRRLSLIGDGLGHIAFSGVAAGFLLQIYPVITALVFTVLGAAGIEWLRSRQRAYGDLILAIFFYSGIAGGVVLSKLGDSLSTAQLFGYLFGSISTIGESDVWFILGLGIVVAAIIFLFYKELFALSFDEATARVSGIRVGTLNMLVAVTTAVTVSLGMRVVGLLMVAALMVIPVATALQLGRGFRATLAFSVLFSMVSLTTGLAASYYLDLPPGGTIVLSAVGLFLATLVLKMVTQQVRRVQV
ncbi:MAG TPA: metal ABC transporter permease [Chloroflexia bacterium]|jgi:zinc transport system permease protein